MSKLNVINITNCNNCVFSTYNSEVDDIYCNFSSYFEYNPNRDYDPNRVCGDGDSMPKDCPIRNKGKIILEIGEQCELTDEEIESC